MVPKTDIDVCVIVKSNATINSKRSIITALEVMEVAQSLVEEEATGCR